MISKKYRTLIEQRLARLEKAINEDMRCESLDDIDDEFEDEFDDDWDDEDDMYESRRRKLERRVRVLERKFASKRTDERGLLRGVIGKVKANKEDAEAIAAILKDKYKIPESLIDTGSFSSTCELQVGFYDREEQANLLKAVAEKTKNGTAKEMYTYYYNVSLSESDKDKMTLKLEKITHKYELDQRGGADFATRDYDYKGKEETLDEVSGLNMASYDKLAKQIVEMAKKNVDPNIISNMCDYKEVGKIIYDGLWKINKKYVNELIDELKNNSLFKNVKWGWEIKDNSPVIRGKFHIDNGKDNLETGTYTVLISLSKDTIEMYHFGAKDKYSVLKYKEDLTGNFAKDFDKAVVKCIPNSRGKIEAGELK